MFENQTSKITISTFVYFLNTMVGAGAADT
jgi:hypothetical protein